MPEASIDEDGNHPPRKGDVRDPTRLLQYLEIDPVAQTSTEQLSTQRDFSPGTCLPDLRHSKAGFFG